MNNEEHFVTEKLSLALVLLTKMTWKMAIVLLLATR